MDEKSDYTPIENDFTSDVVFDFDRVTHINSTGIKYWVQWVDKIQQEFSRLNFWMINCPKAIVDQINMVEGFLPVNATVRSFKVPYYCETCNADKMYTFVLGREYQKTDTGYTLTAPDYTCDKQDCEMEPDVVEKKYFRFLQK